MAIPGLRRARLARGWTQRELAERAGVDLATVGRAECENRDARTSVLLKLAEALGVSADVLLGRTYGAVDWFGDGDEADEAREAERTAHEILAGDY